MLQILGFRPYDYDKDGRNYKGVTVHTIDSDFSDMDLAVGQGVFSKSVSVECFEKFRNGRLNDELINLTCEPVYDKWGKIKALEEV